METDVTNAQSPVSFTAQATLLFAPWLAKNIFNLLTDVISGKGKLVCMNFEYEQLNKGATFMVNLQKR